MLSYPVSPKGVFKVRKITNFLSKISYSESEPDFPNFVVNSLSIFVFIFSESKSESESDDSGSDFSSVFIILDICIYIDIFLTFFCLYLHSSK